MYAIDNEVCVCKKAMFGLIPDPISITPLKAQSITSFDALFGYLTASNKESISYLQIGL